MFLSTIGSSRFAQQVTLYPSRWSSMLLTVLCPLLQQIKAPRPPPFWNLEQNEVCTSVGDSMTCSISARVSLLSGRCSEHMISIQIMCIFVCIGDKLDCHSSALLYEFNLLAVHRASLLTFSLRSDCQWTESKAAFVTTSTSQRCYLWTTHAHSIMPLCH